MRIFYLLGLEFTMACVPKKTAIVKETIFVQTPSLEEYMKLQADCDELRFLFNDRAKLFSQELFIYREELIEQLDWYFPWRNYPESIEKCLDDLQTN